jgi:hypothetical protein
VSQWERDREEEIKGKRHKREIGETDRKGGGQAEGKRYRGRDREERWRGRKRGET